mgnify:CR=1 FL=1
MSRILLRSSLLRAGKRLARGGDGHGHGPMMPPFGRLAPPTGSIPENVELVWDDSVAPESAIDFDAPHVSTKEAIAMFILGFGVFFGFYKLVASTDPAGKNPVAIRDYVLPNHASIEYIGYHSDELAQRKAKRTAELGVKKT